MGIQKYKPTTPGRRVSSVDSFSDITTSTPEKSLTVIKKKHGGRNNQGKITLRHRGGGHKRKIRIIDWHPNFQKDAVAEVLTIEYDPNRSARIALIQFDNNDKRYMLAPDGLMVGKKIQFSSKQIDIQIGNRMKLQFIPTGTLIHNIELQPGKGATTVRSAGSSATLVSQEAGIANVKLPSGEIRKFSTDCMATIGQVSNPDWRNIRWGKAGRMRWRGIRPTVLGKAMNPVDHPHGGGEGGTPIGMKHPKTPQGKPALGVKTRNKHKKSNKFIISRRTKNR